MICARPSRTAGAQEAGSSQALRGLSCGHQSHVEVQSAGARLAHRMGRPIQLEKQQQGKARQDRRHVVPKVDLSFQLVCGATSHSCGRIGSLSPHHASAPYRAKLYARRNPEAQYNLNRATSLLTQALLSCFVRRNKRATSALAQPRGRLISCLIPLALRCAQSSERRLSVRSLDDVPWMTAAEVLRRQCYESWICILYAKSACSGLKVGALWTPRVRELVKCAVLSAHIITCRRCLHVMTLLLDVFARAVGG